MATSVLQPEDCRREHEPKPDILDAPRLTDDDRMHIIEAKERETGDLPPELREQARKELREEPALREQALAQMRHFIEKHPAIKKCRTGKIKKILTYCSLQCRFAKVRCRSSACSMPTDFHDILLLSLY